MTELEEQKLAEVIDKPVENTCTPEHYAYAITPQEYADNNMLPFAEGNVVKYVSRHARKDGYKDIVKAIHYCMFILKRDYGFESETKISDEDGDIVKQLIVEV